MCERCKFFLHVDYPVAGQGACVRYPPAPATGVGRYPVVNASGWCGEFAELVKVKK